MNLFNNKQRIADKINKYISEINDAKNVINYWEDTDTVSNFEMNNKYGNRIWELNLLKYLSFEDIKTMVLYEAQNRINYFQNKLNKLVK